MPIVHVRATHAPDDVSAALTTLAEEVAEAAGYPVRGVWSTFQRLEAQAVGSRDAAEDGPIVYVDVVAQPIEPDAVARLLRAVVVAVSARWEVPLEDVWARLVSARPGEVHAGGTMLG